MLTWATGWSGLQGYLPCLVKTKTKKEKEKRGRRGRGKKAFECQKWVGGSGGTAVGFYLESRGQEPELKAV